MVIKLVDADPEQLVPDLVSNINSVLHGHHAGSVIARACVKRGCTLLVLDVIQTPQSGQGAGALDVSNLALLQVGAGAHRGFPFVLPEHLTQACWPLVLKYRGLHATSGAGSRIMGTCVLHPFHVPVPAGLPPVLAGCWHSAA
jgi:hypothetical protein